MLMHDELKGLIVRIEGAPPKKKKRGNKEKVGLQVPMHLKQTRRDGASILRCNQAE